MSARSPLVSVIVVAYETPAEMLRECLQSVSDSRHRPTQVVVVDNSATNRVAEFLDRWKAQLAPTDPELLVERQKKNLGYAAATNRGIAASSGELVLLLNPDAILEPNALEHLVDAAQLRPNTIGFAPKIRLASQPLVIDSIGLDLHLRGQAGQRGLGEPDIGQYDVEERVAGLCFAAALIRRSAFTSEVVGLLDERYFMFYEDVDWSMRAAIRGRQFWTVPSAEVIHVHSASTRQMRYQFKTRLIQRNWMWTAAKNLERQRVARVFVGLTIRNLLSGSRHGHFLTSVRATSEAWLGLPALAKQRRDVQRTRSQPDRLVLSEPSEARLFNTETYQPVPSVSSLLSALSRLEAVAPNPVLSRLVDQLHRTDQTPRVPAAATMAAAVRQSGIAIGPALEWLLSCLEGQDLGMRPS
ncbi:MAG: glycosyltransferase family 2 protein [Candidatus Dormiibacterota bacterium]